MTNDQLKHLLRLFSALYVSECWSSSVSKGGKLGLFARAKSIVSFDRALNDQAWEVVFNERN